MEEFIIYNQLEKNLISLFNIECPETNLIMSKNPQITDTNMNNNKLLFMKKQICKMKIVGIFKELEEIGLYNDFHKKYCN